MIPISTCLTLREAIQCPDELKLNVNCSVHSYLYPSQSDDKCCILLSSYSDAQSDALIADSRPAILLLLKLESLA